MYNAKYYACSITPKVLRLWHNIDSYRRFVIEVDTNTYFQVFSFEIFRSFGMNFLA